MTILWGFDKKAREVKARPASRDDDILGSTLAVSKWAAKVQRITRVIIYLSGQRTQVDDAAVG